MTSRGWTGLLLPGVALALACAGSAGPAPDETEPPTPAGAPQAREPAPPLESELLPIPERAPAPAPAPPPAPGAGNGYPSPEELEQLGEPPSPEAVFALDVESVERWRLRGPFPDRIGALPWKGEDRWSQLLAGEAERRAGLVLPTEGMRCAARELGLFYLEHRAQPTESLRSFITTRCHAAVPQVAMAHYTADVAAEADETAVFEGVAETTRENLGRALAGGALTAGIWYGRKGNHIVVMLAWGQRQVHVEPVSPFADGSGQFVLEGEVLRPVVGVKALVNRGRFGVAPCEAADDVSLPRFRFVCQVEQRDPQALVSLSLRSPERLLAQAGLNARVWPGRFTSNEYRRPAFGKSRPVEEGDPVAEEFVDLLNRARKEAGLEEVELDTDQSATAQRLAPFFFAALHGQAPEIQAEMIVLGMMAGWGVDGVVESGHFTAAWVMRSTDLSVLLGSALEYPVSRNALLADDIDRVAVGGLLATAEGAEGMAALIGTYSVLTSDSHDELTGRVLEHLEAARKKRGQAPARELVELGALCQGAAAGVRGGEPPQDVMNALMQASVQVLRRPLAGWIAEVGDLDELEFPDEYLDDPGLAVGVSVSHSRRPGEPRGRYVVMLVLASEGLGA